MAMIWAADSIFGRVSWASDKKSCDGKARTFQPQGSIGVGFGSGREGLRLACFGSSLGMLLHVVLQRCLERFLKLIEIEAARRVTIGAGATVLDKITIGPGSIIGAGSVVTRAIPAGVVAYGAPAKVIREL
jgi:hypothetical protein